MGVYPGMNVSQFINGGRSSGQEEEAWCRKVKPVTLCEQPIRDGVLAAERRWRCVASLVCVASNWR